MSIVHRTNPKKPTDVESPVNLYARFALAKLFFKHSVYFRWGRCSLRSHACRVCGGYATSFDRKATVARGPNVRTRAHPFRRASFVFCERLFFCLSTRSTRQHSRKRYARTWYDWWETGAPRARALAHALRACDCTPTKRQSIHWSRVFWEICEKVYRQFVRAGRLLRGDQN